MEGSILAAGVEVEAGATILQSYLGEGVRVTSRSVLSRCVIGAGCHTLIDTHLRRVVALPGSTLASLGTEDLVLGRELFITTGVAFFGGGVGETVRVEGEDTKRPVLGGAVGHRTILGARALFDAGVCVPGELLVVGRPDDAVSRTDDAGLQRALARRGDPQEDA